MKKTRLLCALLALTMMLGMLAGCGTPASSSTPVVTSSSDSGAGEPAPVTISIGAWPTQENDQYEHMENLAATFIEKYPYITIVKDEYLYDPDTFLPKAASGQLPNMYLTWYTEAEKIINAGYAADITDFMKKYNLDQDLNPDLLSIVESDNAYYGVPVGDYTMSMMYNVALFEQAGLVDENGVPLFPKTWEELAQTAVQMKEKTGKPGFFFPTTSNHGGWMFMNIAWGYGVEFETLTDGKWTATFDSPAGVEALQFIKDLRWKHDVLQDNLLVDLNDFVSMYGTDQVAMGLCHINMTRSIVNNTGMSKDNFAVSTTPAGPVGQFALLGGNVYMFAPGTTPEQLDALKLWIDHRGESAEFTDEVREGIVANLENYVANEWPIAKGLKIYTSDERDQQEMALYNQYRNVDMKFWSQYEENSSAGATPEVPVNAQELYKLLDSVIQEVVSNEDADCQALLTQACAEFQKDYLDNAS